MKKQLLVLLPLFLSFCSYAQTGVTWKNVDTAYGPLPQSVHVFDSRGAIDTAPFRAFYLIAELKDKSLDFSTDTVDKRRATPKEFYNTDGQPLVVMNTSFFSYETNRSLNIIMKDGKMLSYNTHQLVGRGKDTFTYRHVFGSALGISKERTADVAWLYTDSTRKLPYAIQEPIGVWKDSIQSIHFRKVNAQKAILSAREEEIFTAWKMQTAIGGGPVLIQHGQVHITNEEEFRFAGKAIHDKHPRTAMGYTSDGHLILLVVEGRNPHAGGATLQQEAELLKELGCVEALNLDGGGSSCLLVNNKETIHPSDKEGERPVPAVFIISWIK
jgi:hypothetical protein